METTITEFVIEELETRSETTWYFYGCNSLTYYAYNGYYWAYSICSYYWS